MITSDLDPLFGKNHLTPVRLVLAGLVVIGHACLLADGHDPIRIHDWTLAWLAVNGFFIVSGMLIAKSLASGRSLRVFGVSRVLRIYPALIVLLLVFALVLAPLTGSGGIGQWAYAVNVLLLGNSGAHAADIFLGNPEPDFNGALWTIRFEIAAYIAAALSFRTGAIANARRTSALLALMVFCQILLPFLPGAVAGSGTLEAIFRLAPPFLVGILLWQVPELRRPKVWMVVLILTAFLAFGDGPFGQILANMALAAIVGYVGLPRKANGVLTSLPDYSYGFYIWHFPVIQTVIFYLPGATLSVVCGISVPVVVMLSAMSWHLVEKPSLRLKRFVLPAKPADAPA